MLKIKTRQIIVSFEYKESLIELRENNLNDYIVHIKIKTKELKMILKQDNQDKNLFILCEDYFTNTKECDPELFFILIEGLHLYLKEKKTHDNIHNILLIVSNKESINNFLSIIGDYYLSFILCLKRNNHGFLLNS